MRTLIVISILLLSTILGFAQEPRFAWKRIGPDGGNISCFIEVDSVLLVGTPGGMFRSVDYGNTWQAVENGLPNSPFTVGNFAFTQGIVFAVLGSPRSDIEGDDVGNFLYASQNQGLSWYPVFSENRINTERFNYISLLDAVDSILIIGVAQKIFDISQARTTWWRSLDKGASWSAMQGVPTTFGDNYRSIPPRKSNSLIRIGNVLFLPHENVGFIRSLDSGKTWRQSFMLTGSSTISSSGNFSLRSALARIGSDIFWGVDSTLYVSRDTGRTWQKTDFSIPRLSTRGQQFLITDVIAVQDTLLVTIAPNYGSGNSVRTYIALANQSLGAIMISSDKGRTWRVRPTTIPYSAPLALLNSKRGLFCSSSDNSQSTTRLQNGLWFSSDGGISWRSANNGIGGYYPSILVQTRKHLYAFSDFERQFSISNNLLGMPNNTFQRIYSDSLFTSNTSILQFAFAIDTVLFLSSSSDLRKSKDGGKTWQNEISNYFQDSTKPFIREAIALEKSDGFVTFASSSRGAVYSINMGTTWLPIPRLSNKIKTQSLELAIDNTTKTIYFKIDDSVFVSSNAGQTWDVNIDREVFMRAKSIRIGNTFILIQGYPFDTFFGSRPALYSRDNGKTFQESKLGLPSSVQIRHLLLQGTTLYAATSRGIYATDIATSISRTNTRETFSLFCAPNPSQDNVYLRFTLPSPAQTRIDIHDMLGRTVLPAITEERGAGEHSTALSVDGLSSGVYSVRLTIRTAAGVRSEAVRLVVVR
jgi:photosystem II stability/assembly factor-like uncharacterized protein